MRLARKTSTQAGRPTVSTVKRQPASNRPKAIPPWARRALPIQASLKVNAPGDEYEQEADRVADQVMRTPEAAVQRQTCSCGRPAGPDGMCDECKRKQSGRQQKAGVQRMPAGTAQTTAPPAVHQALSHPGRPLDNATRNFMETRFQQDFGQVRVHTNGPAASSAEAVNARAYTHGRDIVFNQSQYRPHTATGRQLLAHELSHVIQQQGSATPAAIQRDENDLEGQNKPKPAPTPPAGGATKQPAKKTDVALLLDDSTLAANEARTYASIVIRATSGQDAASKLKALGKPIGTIFVVSHSNSAGQVQVISKSGTISWQSLADFSKALKGALPAGKTPDVVDFRGCKLGSAPGQMETFRQNIGATEARATDCWSFSFTATPLVAPDGSDITSPSQIPAGKGKIFDRALRKQINNMQAANGVKVKNCITGLAKGEKADRSFAKIRQIYFKNGGYLSAGWASPDFNENWQKGSICAKDMTTNTSPCKLVIKK